MRQKVVSRSEIQKFAGALQRQRARKGKTGCATFEKILILRNEIDEEIRKAGTMAENVNILFRTFFQNPVLEMTKATTIETIPNRTLRRLIDEYVEKGYLVELTGKRRDRTFAFKRYVDLFKTANS